MVLDILLGLLGKGKMACSSYLRVTKSHVARAGQDVCISKAYWLADGGGAHPFFPACSWGKFPSRAEAATGLSGVDLSRNAKSQTFCVRFPKSEMLAGHSKGKMKGNAKAK